MVFHPYILGIKTHGLSGVTGSRTWGGPPVGDVERRVDVAASGDARRKGGGNGEFWGRGFNGGSSHLVSGLVSPLNGVIPLPNGLLMFQITRWWFQRFVSICILDFFGEMIQPKSGSFGLLGSIISFAI